MVANLVLFELCVSVSLRHPCISGMSTTLIYRIKVTEV
jgi:hypothetical protein